MVLTSLLRLCPTIHKDQFVKLILRRGVFFCTVNLPCSYIIDSFYRASMTTKDKCSWCKSSSCALFPCQFCDSTPAKYTCAPCYGGALKLKETISGKNDIWACNECMKDKKAGCYQKNALQNWYQYCKEKENADLCVTRSKTQPSLKKPPLIRKEKDSRVGNDEDETADDDEEEPDGGGKQIKATRLNTRYCR